MKRLVTPHSFAAALFFTFSAAVLQAQAPNVTSAITSAAGGCPAPAAQASFTSANRQVNFDFSYTGGNAGDIFVISWYKPDGTLYLSNNFTQPSSGGSWCYWYYISIAGWPPADTLGNWTVKLTWNGTVISSASFAIGAAGNALITTVAGTIGVFPPSPLAAQSAPLGESAGIITDAQGNIHFTDHDNNMVFKVDANTKLTAIGGNGIAGFSGDGGPATAASFDNPRGIAVDASGNVYVADEHNNRVRKISTTGIVTTVAGNGTYGFSGDNGPATAAKLAAPWGMAVDSAGNIYIADTDNNRVRKVDGNGVITTIAGNGTAGSKGDGSLGPAAELNEPLGLAVDAAGANLYIADFGNFLIRKVSLANDIMSTVVGKGTESSAGDGGAPLNAGLFDPEGVAIDNAGDLFISEARGNKIREVSASGVVSTIAGNGVAAYSGDGSVATQASLAFPAAVAVNSANGNVYISDTSNKRIRVIYGNLISTLAGNGNYQYSGDGGSALTAQMDLPNGVTVDGSGNLYIADELNNRVRKVTPQGVISTYAGGGSVYGEAGPATSAALNIPISVLADNAGNIYLIDYENFRVRKISASSGNITTVAGSGKIGYTGDNGLATSASLAYMSGIALDKANSNLYIADSSWGVIRKVSLSSGIITTVAGNGTYGFSGDGGPATKAQLNDPEGIAVDGGGNLYISDQGNFRIRRVDTTGTITTVTGTGTAGYAGIPGPAGAAQIGYPAGMRADGSGNIFFADTWNGAILEVTTGGQIVEVAGGGPYNYSGDGGAAIGAGLEDPVDLAFDSAGNMYIADLYNQRIRKVFTPSNTLTFTAAPASLTFAAVAGGASTGPQAVNLSSALAGLPFVASAGANWITITPSVGSIPATFQVSVNPANLAAGTYSGNISINAGSYTQTVTVSATIAAATPAKLGVDTPLVSLTSPQGGAALTQQLHVLNTGGGSITFTAASATISGGNWLGISATSGSATTSTPFQLTVTGNPGTLSPGTYTGSVTLTGGGAKVTVPVTLSISAPTASILVSQSALSFTAVSQGGSPLPQNIGVLNTGQGSMNWSASAKTLSGGNWLSITPNSGSVATPYLSVTPITVSVNPAGLSAGTYYGTIQVSGLAVNSPQVLTIIFNVLPAGFTPGPQIFPSGLIFTGVPGVTPGSQDVNIGNLSLQANSFQSGVIGNTFSYAPANANLLANQPSTLRVYPNFSSIAPGITRGTITLQFADGSPSQTVNLLFSVAPQGSSADDEVRRAQPRASSCNSQPLQVQFRAPQPLTPFSLQVGQSLTIDAAISDACGNLIGPGSTAKGVNVLAVFSTKETVTLNHIGNGVWQGNWKPSGAGSVAMQIDAVNTQGPSGQSPTLSGAVTTPAPAATTPTLTAQGVVHAASNTGGTPIAPGELITIYGLNLASGTASPNALPLPSNLGGATVLLGAQPLPILYTSTGQLNVQVPYSVPLNTQYQLSVMNGNAVSVPQQLVVAAAQPGIFTKDESGSGQGDVLKSDQVTLAQPGTPAAKGEAIVIYCTGLGAVTGNAVEGQPAPSSPPAVTTNPVTVSIGGVQAQVLFAGLTPGFAGLYQVNAIVPQGAPSGNAVPVTITVAGQASPTVTMAIQ